MDLCGRLETTCKAHAWYIILKGFILLLGPVHFRAVLHHLPMQLLQSQHLHPAEGVIVISRIQIAHTLWTCVCVM